MATLVDYMVDGNGYWIKLRDRSGIVRELWWAPSWTCKPVSEAGSNALITHYNYTPSATTVELPVTDVVHFRFGLDPDNPRLGMSPLKSVLREVFTDDEAANFTASLLRNMGVPGLVVSPEQAEARPSSDDVAATKAYFKGAFTGDRRGEPLVMSGPTRVAQFGFSPEQLLLRELRRIPEERVTAVMGVPAIVAGLGAGLERSTFSNMAEAREAAYESGLIPTQRILSEEVRFQLLSDFEPDPFAWRFGFDLSKVRVLQEDLTRQAERFNIGVNGGWVKVSEARAAVGLAVEDGDDVYLRPLNVREAGPDAEPEPEPEPPVEPPVEPPSDAESDGEDSQDDPLYPPSDGSENGSESRTNGKTRQVEDAPEGVRQVATI
jgi:HK97 family phage portal protein